MEKDKAKMFLTDFMRITREEKESKQVLEAAIESCMMMFGIDEDKEVYEMLCELEKMLIKIDN